MPCFLIVFIFISEYIGFIIACINTIIGIGGMTILSVHVITYKIEHNSVWFDSKRVTTQTSVTQSKTNSNSKQKLFKLYQVLQSKEIISFAHHLIYEFSLECLTSYIEFIQYKQLVMKTFNMHSNSQKNTPNSEITHVLSNLTEHILHPTFCDDIPISLLINNIKKEYKIMNIKSLKILAYNLYLKYIKLESEYEINISYLKRNYYITLMDNKTLWFNNDTINEDSLFTLFDDIILIMYDLMDGSFSRFIYNTNDLL